MEFLLDASGGPGFMIMNYENNVMKFSMKFVDRFEMAMFQYVTTKLKCKSPGLSTW